MADAAPLLRIDENMWVATRPLRFFGLEVGARMTVVRLEGGGLFVHSPVALDEATRRAVDELGPVRAIVAPNRLHHLYVGAWAGAYPGATLCASPGLEAKRPDVAWGRTLGDESEPEWRGELDQVVFSAFPLANEVVFFHRRSRTLVCADFLFNLARHPSRFTRAVAPLLQGRREPGVTLLERVLLRDRAAARGQLERIVAWGAERVVPAHGAVIERGGADIVARAYGWV
jgi:hypothetical protein